MPAQRQLCHLNDDEASFLTPAGRFTQIFFDRAQALREIQATHKTIGMVAEVLMRSSNDDGQGKGQTASHGLQFWHHLDVLRIFCENER